MELQSLFEQLYVWVRRKLRSYTPISDGLVININIAQKGYFRAIWGLLSPTQFSLSRKCWQHKFSPGGNHLPTFGSTDTDLRISAQNLERFSKLILVPHCCFQSKPTVENGWGYPCLPAGCFRRWQSSCPTAGIADLDSCIYNHVLLFLLILGNLWQYGKTGQYLEILGNVW